MKTVRVAVPATSANLGPGFDVLGLALPLYNRFGLTAAERFSVRHTGDAAGLPEDESHMAHQAAVRLCEQLGCPVPVWAWDIEVAIPPARGLGSSASAIVGGLMAANAYFDQPLDRAALLDLATNIEGHPDNVAPALFGGVTAAFSADARTHCIPLAASVPAALALVVPAFELETSVSRRALPAEYSRADVVANLAAVTALTTVMLKGDIEWWPYGLRDRIHQPYRLALVPGGEGVVAAGEAAGAWGVVLSGAGPSLLAFCPIGREAAVASAMATAWRGAGSACRTFTFEALASGARVEA